MTGTLLSLGHGYSARALAARLRPKGWRIVGTARSPEGLRAIAEAGDEALPWPGSPLAPALARATHLLVSIPPGPEGDPVLAAERPALAAAGHLTWAGYLSTTGVYGDRGGDWVDEQTPPAPATPRGVARLEAERAWAEVAAEAGFPLAIFRLAGIYGPGRSPFARIRDGSARRILKAGQVFSRIHVDDIAAALEASMAAPRAGAVYNLCDDEPAPPEDVLAHAAALLGLPPPPAEPFETADLSPMARSFYAESKRVRNTRLRQELGVALAYPTFREGLAAILKAEGGSAPGRGPEPQRRERGG
jgi:nucleoside-diphosphate-sugar epimerase